MSQGYTKGIPIDTDSYLTANSEFIVPSQSAVKTFLDRTGVAAVSTATNNAFSQANAAFDKANSANVLAFNTGIGANNYAGFMANSINVYVSTTYATLGNLTTVVEYAGVMANSANGYAETIVSANLVTAKEYTNTSTSSANNYAGAMANSANAWAAATFATITNAAAAFSSANQAGVIANAAFAAANQAGTVANNANSYADTTYVKKAGDTISGDLVVQGNLTTSGVVTYANTQTLLIGDALITLNADIPGDVAPSENAGVEVKRGSSANVSIIWNEAGDKWTFTNDGTTWLDIASNVDVGSANNYAGTMANAAGTIANAAFESANTAGSLANQAGVIANAAFDKANLGGAAIVNVSTTGPTGNTNGTLWWNSDTGKLLVYYTDVDSSQWVEASPVPDISSVFSAANNAANSANGYANTIGVNANTWANTVGVNANTWANSVGVNANTWANTKLSNTAGISFAGGLYFPPGSNVGIGTTAPAVALDVVGSVSVSSNSTFTNASFTTITVSSNSTFTNASFTTIVVSGNSTLSSITSTGNSTFTNVSFTTINVTTNATFTNATFTNPVYANGFIRILPVGGDAEGGQLELQGTSNNSSTWVMDSYYNQLRFYNGNNNAQLVSIFNSGSGTMQLQITGNVIPGGVSNTYDLGSSTARWRNIYTGDLHLSNEFGNWTIVEGEDELFLYNNKKGKTYKFNLTEVDPSTVPPKKGE